MWLLPTVAIAMIALVGTPAGAATVSSSYFLGNVGENCVQTCLNQGRTCNPAIHTNDSTAIFSQLGVQCKTFDTAPWWASDQPSIDVTDAKCVGYINVPQAVACQGRYPTTRRICKCDAVRSVDDLSPFGTGYSQGEIGPLELPVFAHVVAPGVVGVMTHFWLTPSSPNVTIRYYVDGEANASIAFTPSMAAGVGFDDQSAPWGTKWFGKGAKTGAWFWNFRVPFHKSILVTATSASTDVLYIILRGAPLVPINIGGINVPLHRGARLVQQVFEESVPAQTFVPIVDIAQGPGVFFMHTLSFEAPNWNTLEGCFHLYSPRDQAWPGTLLSTGTEDFFDSAYYFDGGEFRLPVSGFTHKGTSPRGNVTFSAYRFHEEDPIVFGEGGLRVEWRNGDQSDASGIKCLIQSGGQPNGSPQTASVRVYSWSYVWQ